MKLYKFEPKTIELQDEVTGQVKKDDKGEPVRVPSPFTGHIMVEVPKYIERLQYIKDMKLSVGDSGEVKGDVGNIDQAIKVVEIAKKHIKEVALTVVSTGQEVKSLEDLEYSFEGSQLMNEVANLVLSGIKLGNK
jgi:hypothetical protein